MWKQTRIINKCFKKVYFNEKYLRKLKILKEYKIKIKLLYHLIINYQNLK